MPLLNSIMQRSHPFLILQLNICFRLYQQACAIRMTMLYGNMQGSMTFRISEINGCSIVQQ